MRERVLQRVQKGFDFVASADHNSCVRKVQCVLFCLCLPKREIKVFSSLPWNESVPYSVETACACTCYVISRYGRRKIT